MKNFTRDDVRILSHAFEVPVYRVGYCDLQNMTKFLHNLGHNYGIYGWNFDAYYVPNKCILVTGYRNLIGKEFKSGLVSKYDDMAHNILHEVCNPAKAEQRISALWDEMFEEQNS